MSPKVKAAISNNKRTISLSTGAAITLASAIIGATQKLDGLLYEIKDSKKDVLAEVVSLRGEVEELRSDFKGACKQNVTIADMKLYGQQFALKNPDIDVPDFETITDYTH